MISEPQLHFHGEKGKLSFWIPLLPKAMQSEHAQSDQGVYFSLRDSTAARLPPVKMVKP